MNKPPCLKAAPKKVQPAANPAVKSLSLRKEISFLKFSFLVDKQEINEDFQV
jgi:hypothetical protein